MLDIWVIAKLNLQTTRWWHKAKCVFHNNFIYLTKVTQLDKKVHISLIKQYIYTNLIYNVAF